MINIKTFKVGKLFTNCYFIFENKTNHAIILDPGGKIKNFEEILKNYKIDYILITHGHFDHILKAEEYKKLTDAKIVISEKEKEFLSNNKLNLSEKFLKENTFQSFSADIFVADGDTLKFGEYEIKVLSTPGHTRGGVCYILGNNLFSGDTLFCNTYGSTDFPTGNKNDLVKSLKKLANLEGEYNVYPGHSKNTLLSFQRHFIKNLNTNVYF